MDEKRLEEFLQWLPTKFEEFQNKFLDEVAQTLNNLYETDEGKQTIETLWNTFMQEADSETSLFAKGGKLDYLVQLHKKGGSVKKCECGCTLNRVFKDGGVIEECACGCKISKAKKKQVESYQTGGDLDIPTGKTTWWTEKFRGSNVGASNMPKPATPFTDGKGQGTAAELLTGNGTLHQFIGRNGGGYTNVTRRVITDWNTPKADTTLYTPRGNPHTTRTAPTYNAKFEEIFTQRRKK